MMQKEMVMMSECTSADVGAKKPVSLLFCVSVCEVCDSLPHSRRRERRQASMRYYNRHFVVDIPANTGCDREGRSPTDP